MTKVLKPLTPRGDYNVISPCDTHTLSNELSLRILTLIR